MSEIKVGDEIYFIELGRVKKGKLVKRTVIYEVLVGPVESGAEASYNANEKDVFASEREAEKERFKRMLEGK